MKEISYNNLRDYQRVDVEFLKHKKSIAIFNEMRTGKTPTALCIYEKWPVQNLLIICPASLQIHWQKSVEQWLDKPVKIVSGLSQQEREMVYMGLGWLNKQDWIVIVSKDTFKRDAYVFKAIRKSWSPSSFCVIVDEGHFLRNYKAQQSKSIYTLNDVEYKMVLTGTPMVNHASDIFGILHFLKSHEYPDYEKFVSEYFFVNYFRRHIRVEKKNGELMEFTLIIPKVLGYQSQKKKDKLQSILNDFSTQRTQEETMPWLPKVDYQQVDLDLSPEQRNIYDKWMSGWDLSHPLELLSRLKSLILHPPSTVKEKFDKNGLLIENDKKEHLTIEEEVIMKNCLGVKIDYLLDFCSKAYGQNIVIFSTRSDTFLVPLSKYLKAKDLKVELIVGDTPMRGRHKLVEAFQNKEIDILCCNVISAGVGLNLSQADIIIFADRAWSPADNDQAEDRFLPIQKADVKPKMVIDLVCQKTIDEKVIELLKKKQDITKLVIDNPSILF